MAPKTETDEISAATAYEPAASNAPASSATASDNKWPDGTRVMVRKRRSWREAAIVARLDRGYWRAEYPGGGSGMFKEADIRAYDAERDAKPPNSPAGLERPVQKRRSGRDIASTPRRSLQGGFPKWRRS